MWWWEDERINNIYHGINGQLKVSDPKYISRGAYIYIKTLQEMGINYTNDFNEGNAKGVGFMQLTTDGKKDVVLQMLS